MGNLIPGFEKIVEERIQSARRQGCFENLEGAGRPITIEDDHHIPEDLRLAFKILKNAGCVPPEIELRREIRRTEDLIADMPDTVEKYRLLKKLNFLIMRLNSLGRLSVEREMPQRYYGKIADRMDGNRA